MNSRHILTEADIATIEKLVEKKLDDKTKEILLALFGGGGRREEIWAMQAEDYAKCDNRWRCSDCGLCTPYREGPLLKQVLEIIERPHEAI